MKQSKEVKQTKEAGNKPASATSHFYVDWHTISWSKVHQNVRQLQARIVKAAQFGRWNKVKILQHRLTRSFSGRALAVKRVTENQGKNTTGIDGEIWNTPKKKATAIHALKEQRKYHPSPLRRVYIPKSNGKLRPLGIPTMMDRAMQALYLLALDPIAEVTADLNSYGFRKQRSIADAIQQCFTVLAQKNSAQWILEGDIKACFDGISHDWLLANIPMDKTMLRKWLKAGFVDKHVLYPTEEGTPQGGIISPVLANMALDGLEKMLKEAFPKTNKKGKKAKINFVRYADDFIITASSRELLEKEVKPLVEQFLRKRGLELSPEKTIITHISDGFDFLGKNIRKYNGKLLIKPSKKNIHKFLDKVRGVIKDNKQATAGQLIAKLNPMIRGWANHHRDTSSKETFVYVDHAIFKTIWQWCKRRHPDKGRQWIKKKYFKTKGDQNWVFHGTNPFDSGQIQELWLFQAAKTTIVRHVKVKGNANPYDPQWETYFEKRIDKQMLLSLSGNKKLKALWKQQRGKCPVCHQKITRETGWNSHHIIWKSKGGPSGNSNRVLLHPNCHQLVHNQGIHVEKPRPTKGR